MGKEERLRYVVETVRKGQQVTANAVRDFQKMGDAAKSSNLKWTELASGLSVAKTAFNTIMGAARTAYEVVGEGAAISDAEMQFGRLAQSVGTTANALKKDLQEATSGTVSEMELMASASELMSLKLTRSHDETVRMTAVAGKLQWNMQALIMEMNNMTGQRLDALGLSMEEVQARAKELEESGYGVRDAYAEAIIELGEARAELLGLNDAAQTATGQLAILNAEWQDFTDNAKQGVAEKVAPAIRAINLEREATEKLTFALNRGLITQEQYNQGIAETWKGSKAMEAVIQELTEVINEYNSQAVMGKEATDELVNSTGMMVNVAADAAASWEEYVEASGKAILPTSNLTGAAIGANAAFMDWAATTRDMKMAAIEAEEELSPLAELILQLEGERSSTMNFSVYGVDTLREARDLMAAIGGGQTHWEDEIAGSSAPAPGEFLSEGDIIDNPSIPVMPVPPSTQPADPGFASGFNITQNIGAGVDADMVRRATVDAYEIAIARGRN